MGEDPLGQPMWASCQWQVEQWMQILLSYSKLVSICTLYRQAGVNYEDTFQLGRKHPRGVLSRVRDGGCIHPQSLWLLALYYLQIGNTAAFPAHSWTNPVLAMNENGMKVAFCQWQVPIPGLCCKNWGFLLIQILHPLSFMCRRRCHLRRVYPSSVNLKSLSFSSLISPLTFHVKQLE